MATNSADVLSQNTEIITRNQPGLSLIAPVVTADLPTTRAFRGVDNISSDDTVTGTITAANPITSFEAQLDQSSAVDVLSSLTGTTFTITSALLSTINGGPVADGKHTLTLIAKDSNGNSVSAGQCQLYFDHHAPAPVTPQLLDSSDTGISSTDGITRHDANLQGG